MREEVLYVLRLWRDTSDREGWRASLEDLRRDNRQVFPTIEALVEHLTAHKGQERQ